MNTKGDSAAVVPLTRRQTKAIRGNLTHVAVLMTETEISRLDRLSELTGLSARSEIIRAALLRMLRDEEGRAASMPSNRLPQP